MSTIEDLAAWGEQPPNTEEAALAAFLETALGKLEKCEELSATELLHGPPEIVHQGEQLVRDTTTLYKSAGSVWEHSGLLAEVSPDAVGPDKKPEPDPDATIDPPLPDPLPGEFRIRQLLGAGTFGQVWLAEDLKLDNRPVALKTLHYTGQTHEVARALTALQKEAGVLAKFRRHPNIVQVYAWREAAGRHYLVLEYVAGGSLAARLKNEKSLSWQDASRYIADVGEGLVAVHSHGIVHRDIKPANILWNSTDDEAMLTDFGVVAHLSEVGGSAGTYAYMAPESIRRQVKQEHATALDVYGLAASLFHLITGSFPFPANNSSDLARQIEQGLPDPDPRCVGMPERLEQIIRSGLSLQPDQRPTLRDFVDTLRSSLNQLMADTLLPQDPQVGWAESASPTTAHRHEQPPARVNLRLLVSRLEPDGSHKRVATTPPTRGVGGPPAKSRGLTRDMKKVPRPPEQVRLRTGDRISIDVVADRTGFLTVFNIGPTGNLNLLYPDELPDGSSPPSVKADEPLGLAVELMAPAGRERLFAVWSRTPLPLRTHELLSLAQQSTNTASRPYRATRDLKRVQESVERLRPDDCQTVVLELDHE